MMITKNKSWDESYADLVAYHKKNGHCNVPFCGDKKYPNLGLWIRYQRQRHPSSSYERANHSPLRPEQVIRLDALGFIWRVTDRPGYEHNRKTTKNKRSWDESYAELVAYHKKHGHCRVTGDEEYPNLGLWVRQQRQRYPSSSCKRATRSPLRPDQVNRLDALGFIWRVTDPFCDKFEKQWNNMFEQLKLYKLEHDDCKVPFKYKENPSLAIWMQRQKKLFKNGTIRNDRKEKLENIGFFWRTDPSDKNQSKASDKNSSNFRQSWDAMFDRLVKYREVHGNCKVPYKYKDAKLGKWVSNQRYSRASMNTHRLERLNSIGFCWGVRRGRVAHRGHKDQGEDDTEKEFKNLTTV